MPLHQPRDPMPSYWSIVQFLPNSARLECINIGVVAFDDSGVVRTRFLSDWARVVHFAGRDVTLFLKEVAEDAKTWRAEDVTKMSRRGHGAIQVTRPGLSLPNIDRTIESIAKTYLVDGVPAIEDQGIL